MFQKTFDRVHQATHEEATRSLAVADQDLVASCADLRTIGLQASQHPHGVLICGLAELTDCGRAGSAFLRRSLLLRLSQCGQGSPDEGHSYEEFLQHLLGSLHQLSQLLAGIKHAGLHRGGRDAENLCGVVHRLLVIIDEVDNLAVFGREFGQGAA